MKTVLVTGGAKRTGRAIALALAAAGYAVYVHYLTSEGEAATLCREIEAGGGKAVAISADLADPAAALALVDRCTALGPLSTLVNNAAVYRQDTIADLTAEGLGAQFAVNLRAPLLLARSFGALSPRQGAIVNLLDFRIAAMPGNFLSYSLSKAALAAATESLALALAPHIRVNGVAPGLMLESDHEHGARFDVLATENLLKCRVTPDDVAAAVMYLLSASAVTGTILTVDAGKRLVTTRGLPAA